MIEFAIQGKTIEMVSYSDDATLAELRSELDAFRDRPGLKTATCAGCGECCYYETLPVLGYDLESIRGFLNVDDSSLFANYLELPEQPSAQQRTKSIDEMIRDHKFESTTASLLYEYNQAEPIKLRKNPHGSCMFLEDDLCAIYQARLYTCGLYVCNMADRLSVLQEQIVRQGIWHSYHVLGWIDADLIGHNPFLHASGYGEVLIKDFDFDLSEAIEKLFFYF
jgi:Fe-S-cluster containining protein